MTLVIAVKGKNFVLCGADSRITIDPIAMHKETGKKLFEINNCVCVLLYGSLEIANYIIEEYIKSLNKKKKKKGVTFIANDFSDFCNKELANRLKYYKNFISITPSKLFDFGVIVAGLDKKGNSFKPEIYVLESDSLFSIDKPQEDYVIRGKYILAEYIFKKGFEEFEGAMLPLSKLTTLLLKAIDETYEMDNEVGQPTQLVLIESGKCKPKSNDITQFYKTKEGAEEE